MAKTAVVILNFNGEKYLKKFLSSVIKYSQEADIIVADNASTDQSIETLKNEFPSVRSIVLPKNHGFAGGYNKALKQIKADYYALLNSDVEVTENWLSPMIKFLDKNPSYAACQPKIKDFNDPSSFEYAGASGGFIDFMGYPFCRGRIFDTVETDSGQYNQPIDIFWASGACLFIRSKVFLEAGGFDEEFFAHMEEIDLCWRLHSLGYKIKSIPQSTIYHVGGGTLSKSNTFKTYLNFRNGLYLLIKNLPCSELLLKLIIRVILDWVAAIKFLIKDGNITHSIAVLKAHFSVLTNLLRMIKKRNITSTIPCRKIMIFEYYFRKKKKFSDLYYD